MDTFNKITVSNFIWYLVPGLGLIFFILFPLIVFQPHATKMFIDTVGPFGLIILGSILGFLLDGLRLYRFRPGYFKIKNIFFQKLQSTIAGIDNPYLIQSLIYDVAKNKNITGLSLHHAIWIMLGHFAILALLEGFYWLLTALYFTYMKISVYHLFGAISSQGVVLMSCVAFGLLFVLIGFRLLYIANEDQNTTNNMFSSFAEQHRDEILQLFNVTPRG